MLKLMVQVQCDDCGQQFPFARTSDYTTDALSFNTNALIAMLPHCFWSDTKSGKDRFHFCQHCYNEFQEMHNGLA